MSSEPRARVRVPGSTSNLGPGFDVLGLALDVGLEVRVLGPSQTGAHELAERGGTATEWPGTPDDVLFRAFERVARALGATSTPLRFAAHSDIPVARGLGSSGAACAAGLLLGAALLATPGRAPTEAQLVRLGVELEGHPENSTASLLGGAVLCVPEPDGPVHVVRQALAPSLRFVVAWPSARVATGDARAVLPASVPFADAVENPRRLALLLEGLRTGDPVLLRAGVHDRLHARHRLRLVTGGAEALAAAESAGAHCATISGSGSTLIALCAAEAVESVRAALRDALAPHHDAVEAREVRAVVHAPRVERG